MGILWYAYVEGKISNVGYIKYGRIDNVIRYFKRLKFKIISIYNTNYVKVY